MDHIEEILNLRELVMRLSNRVAALEGSNEKIELIKCSKCGVERHPLFKRQCLDPECEGGLTIGACPPKSLMTSEPCHGLILEDVQFSNVNRKDIEEYKREMENLSQYWRDNPDKAPKFPMRTITQKVYIAEDGKEFTTEIACKAYEAQLEADEKDNTYWRVIHKPDLTEGRGHYGLIFVKVKQCECINTRIMIEDYCHRTFGRPVAFVQGRSAIENWRILESNKDAYIAGGEIKVGDYTYKGKRLDLTLGIGDSGLTIIS